MNRLCFLLTGFALATALATTAQAETYRLLVATTQGQLRSVAFTEQGQGETPAQALDDIRERALSRTKELLQGKIDERGLNIELSFLGEGREQGPRNFIFIRSWHILPVSGKQVRVEADVEAVYLLTPKTPPPDEASLVLPPVPELELQPAGRVETKTAQSIKKENQRQYDLLEKALSEKLEQLMGNSP